MTALRPDEHARRWWRRQPHSVRVLAAGYVAGLIIGRVLQVLWQDHARGRRRYRIA